MDYNYYATPDRKFISSPLTTDIFMNGGWTLLGGDFQGKVAFIKYNVFAVNNIDDNQFGNLGTQLEMDFKYINLFLSYLNNEQIFDANRMSYYDASVQLKVSSFFLEDEYIF